MKNMWTVQAIMKVTESICSVYCDMLFTLERQCVVLDGGYGDVMVGSSDGLLSWLSLENKPCFSQCWNHFSVKTFW